jgi:alcohol dehydrogenase class IV
MRDQSGAECGVAPGAATTNSQTGRDRSTQPIPPFVYAAPGEIRFGWAEARSLPEAAAKLGRRPLLVTGSSLRRTGGLEPLLSGLRATGLDTVVHAGVPAEPTLAVLQHAMDVCAAAGADMVIAVGGGSVLDIGKAAAALAGSGGTAEEFFAGRPLPEVGRPIIALPTTSGTGSEVTRVCVLSDPARRRKASIRADSMLPRLAILDPEMTVSCPPSVTAHSGMDALVQAVEAYVATGANPLTDALALEGARLAAGALETAVADGADQAAREAMALGSLMAGLALNMARLGLVHGLAHPIGALTGAAHGLLCGMLLPAVMEFNLPAATEKYAHLARELGAAPAVAPDLEAARALIAFAQELGARVGLPARLEAIGLSRDCLEYVAAEAMPSGSTKANPRPVSQADALAVARAAW